jgi:hypothetical protein
MSAETSSSRASKAREVQVCSTAFFALRRHSRPRLRLDRRFARGHNPASGSLEIGIVSPDAETKEITVLLPLFLSTFSRAKFVIIFGPS